MSTETPFQLVSSFDHFVTQWMSVVIVSEGRATNSSHGHDTGSSTAPRIVKLHSSNGVWGVGLYENGYVKERGTWKISKLHFYVTALTDYDAGFMRSALRMDGPSALYPPDRPPTEVYRAYPSAYVPPFSYVHPVTGQPLSDIPQPADTVARPQR